MKVGFARALVAGSSAAVLVLEILAGRLLAPYVGVSLETFTGIIGIVLAGIATGAWAGGVLADAGDGRRLIGAALTAGGVLTWLALPILDALGNQFGDSGVASVVLSVTALFLPAAALSAVPPMVAKLLLSDLGDTGSVVGGLSAAGTLGALAGTFITGFVLVATLPTRPTVIGLGALLVVTGGVVHGYLTRAAPTAGALALVVVGGVLTVVSGDPCDFETTYFCGSVAIDEDNPSGRSLFLDRLRHAYVDLEDPTNLDVRYIRLFAQVADSMPTGTLDSLHIGGGGFSFPRYQQHVRPGSADLVLEIDDKLVDVLESDLGLVGSDTLRWQIGDARLALDKLADDRFDLVVGDAFASRAVPWHLTTGEFINEIDRVLNPGGIYAMNVIDGGELRFMRAEVATLREVFANVAAIAPPEADASFRTANYILVASQMPLPRLSIDPADGTLLAPDELDTLVDDAKPLRDDFAPVDQLQE